MFFHYCFHSKWPLGCRIILSPCRMLWASITCRLEQRDLKSSYGKEDCGAGTVKWLQSNADITLASRCPGASIQNHWVPTALVLIMRVQPIINRGTCFIYLPLSLLPFHKLMNHHSPDSHHSRNHLGLSKWCLGSFLTYVSLLTPCFVVLNP